MILDKSDDEDSDSEPELSQPKRRRTVLLSDTEESGQEDDIGIVEEATIDESVGDINFAIGETTYVVELDINEISLGRWVKISYDGALVFGANNQKEGMSQIRSIECESSMF